jgi:hypothetical protein
MNSRADPTVGQPAARAQTTTRRGTPWQDRSPSFLWLPAPAGTTDTSQGPPPAHPRHAISTREHQTGGAPTRSAPTRRAHPTPRPPPTQHGDRLTRRVKTVRPRADALRALRLDPTGRRRLPRTGWGTLHTTDKPALSTRRTRQRRSTSGTVSPGLRAAVEEQRTSRPPDVHHRPAA